jgi:hypothetical protein
MTFLSFIISFLLYNLLLLGGLLSSAEWSFTAFKEDLKNETTIKVFAFLNFLPLVMIIILSLE